MIGKTIAHYQITGLLGKGGMGEVYRARDEKLGREVALKLLPPEFVDDRERLARFQREARTLATLNHPNIAAVHEVGEAGGHVYLTMELVEGVDLAERIRQGPMPIDTVLDLARQLARGLAQAHDKGVIHRDLKPANLKVDPDGQLKILDFGLARVWSEETSGDDDLANSPTITAAVTQHGVILGTAAYMSPEQAKGRTVDQRSDIWAFGVIVWEMLVGQQLFVGDSVSDTLAGVLRQELDVSELPSSTPPGLRMLVERCLHRDRKQRLQHIGDASIFLDGPTIFEGSETTQTSTGPWRWVALGLGVISIALAAMILAPKDEAPVAESPQVRRWSFEPTGGPGDLNVAPTISPDGSKIAYSNASGLWVRRLDELQPRRIYEGSDCTHAIWSPDSRWIAFVQGDRIYKILPDGGLPTPMGSLTTGAGSTSGTITWDEQDRIVIGTGSTGLLHIPAPGAESEEFVPVSDKETDFHEVAAIPGARGWVFVVHEGSGSYGRIDLFTADQERRTLLHFEDTNVGNLTVDPSGYLLFRRGGSNAGIWAAMFSLDELEVTGPPFLVAQEGRNPSVSDDGTLVFTIGSQAEAGELAWLDRSGNTLQVLGDVRTTRPFPYLLPGDREFIMCVSADAGRDIWYFDATTGLGRQIQKTSISEEIVVASSDGSTFYTYAASEEGYAIFRFPRLTPSEVEKVAHGIIPHVRDDLGFLYYSYHRPNTFIFDIYELSLDDLEAEPRVLVDSDHVDWGVTTSPNGKYLTYCSNESGKYEVYLTQLPEARARWQVSASGGQWPHWRGDGREIYYVQDDAIYSVGFDDANGVKLDAPTKLFDYASSAWAAEWENSFDVDEKGERFIVIRRRSSDAMLRTEIVVVENWASELESR